MNIAIYILYSFDFENKDFSVAIGNLAGGAELPYLILMYDYLRLGVLNCKLLVVKFFQHINSKKRYVLPIIPNLV